MCFSCAARDFHQRFSPSGRYPFVEGSIIATKQEPGERAPVRLRLTVPLSPGINRQYATVGRRRVLTATARVFKRDVKKLVDRSRIDGTITLDMERSLQASLLGVYLTFFFETPHRRDLDGGLKITLDAVCDALGLDDRAVVELHLTKRIDPLHPHVDVEIESIAEWSFDRSYVYLGEERDATDDTSAKEASNTSIIPT